MSSSKIKSYHVMEIILIVVSLGLSCILYEMNGYKMIVLNLFYLPIVLAAFYLGRYRSGVLALLCVIMATVIIALDISNFSSYMSPMTIALSVVVWGSVLGITTILVGTLSDERNSKLLELQEAHLGVIEVLSHYLQSAGPREKNKTNQVAELSQKVAQQMKLPEREVENIRVAALLQDMENIEVTAKVLRSAMGSLENPSTVGTEEKHTFQGSDLVQSLGEVLTGAIPLLMSHDQPLQWNPTDDAEPLSSKSLFGVKIIHAVRDYHSLSKLNRELHSEIMIDLQKHVGTEYDAVVLQALDKVIRRQNSEFGTPSTDEILENLIEA